MADDDTTATANLQAVDVKDIVTEALVQPETLTALLARMDAEEAPIDAADPLETAFLEAVDKRIRKKIGPLPWVRRTLPGQVLSVQAKTCTVRVAGIDVAVTGVLFGPSKPQVGDVYPVRFPVSLPPEGVPLIHGPVPYGSPWIKVPGGERWLYRQVNGPPMQRWAWPPPGPDDAWDPELVNESSIGTLVGAMTEEGHSTSIITVDFESSTDTIRGSVNPSSAAGAPLNYKDHHYEYPSMGFEPSTRNWRISPPSVHVGAVANEGTAMAGSDTTDSFLPLPPTLIHGTSLEVAGIDECCADNPFFPPIPPARGCAQNIRYKWVESTSEYLPLRYFGFNDSVNIWRGALGQMGQIQAVQNHYTALHMVEGTPDPINYLNSYVSGTCHWTGVLFPIAVVFDSQVNRLDVFPRTGGESYQQNFAGRFNGLSYTSTQLAFPFGAWGPDAGIVAAIYHDQGIKAAPFPAIVGSNILDDHDVRIWLSVNGVSHDLTIDPTGDHIIIQPTLLAYDYDAAMPIVLALVIDVDADTDSLQKWHGAWQVLTGANFAFAVSRDGTDILGMTRFGQQVYSLDGGATWTNCAQFPASTPTDLGFKFVDELA